MRSKGSRFTLGVWEWRCVRLMLSNPPQPFATIRNHSQPFATGRNRPCEDHMAVPIGSFLGGIIFGGFTCHVASFCVAGVTLRDMSTCLVTCRSSFCEILLRLFQNMRCIFRRRRSTLDVSSSMFRGRRSTSDVSCVLFANRIGKATRSGGQGQIAWQVWHFVRCDEIWRKRRTKHRF